MEKKWFSKNIQGSVFAFYVVLYMIIVQTKIVSGSASIKARLSGDLQLVNPRLYSWTVARELPIKVSITVLIPSKDSCMYSISSRTFFVLEV